MCAPCVHHEKLMSLDITPNPNSDLDSSWSFQTVLDSVTWLPVHALFLHCRLIIILSIYVWLTLTLAKVCPHTHLITLLLTILTCYNCRKFRNITRHCRNQEVTVQERRIDYEDNYNMDNLKEKKNLVVLD